VDQWNKDTISFSIPRNSDAYADISPERLYHSRSRFSKKVMVSVGVSWNGKTGRAYLFHWSTWKQKWTRTVTLICWRHPYCLNVDRRLYPGIDFVFMQDSAPSHHAKATQQFLRQNTPDFIAADEWTSYSPDFNPLDYCIWDILQTAVRRPTTSVCKLYRTSMKQLKTSGIRSPLRQFEKITQAKNIA